MGYSLKETSDVIFFNKETNEEVMRMDSVSISSIKHTSDESINEYIGVTLSPISIEADILYMDAETIAIIANLHNEPLIKKLINIKKRTKSKRIKNKLNKRILNEVNKLIFQKKR